MFIDQTDNIDNIASKFDVMDKKITLYFTKEELTPIKYKNNIKIEFEYTLVAFSKNGGLIAFIKQSKVKIMGVNNPLKDNVLIMCQDGSNAITIPFSIEKEKLIVLFDFNDDEKLYLITNDCRIFKFDVISMNVQEKFMSKIFKENETIFSAKLFEKGFVCLTEKGNFYYIKDLKDPIATLFFPMKTKLNFTNEIDYLFIPSANSKSGKIELLITNQNEDGILNIIESEEKNNFDNIYIIKNDHLEPFKKNNEFLEISENNFFSNNIILGKISAIALSPEKKQIALYKNDGTIFFFHISFDSKNYPPKSCKLSIENSERNFRESEKSELKSIISYGETEKNDDLKISYYQFLFAGEDAICLCGKRFILVINIKNKTLIYKMIEKESQSAMLNSKFMHCISEIDGLRIITNSAIFFISKVSKELYETCFPFSSSTSRKLLNAYKSSCEKNPNCDVIIRQIANDLPKAIKTLEISAANLFWLEKNQNKNNKNKQIQIFLLKAAQFGKSFVQQGEFNFDRFVDTCKNIRIINNLRNNEKPRFITFNEIKKMKNYDLIKKLLRNQNFYLAFEISKFLDLETKQIYEKWAIAQVKKMPLNYTNADEIKIYEKIKKKLENVDNISFIKIAKKCFKCGRNEIGMKFLENEKSLLTKIPQYIELKKWFEALELAFNTMDSNVILTVIDKMFKVEEFNNFINITNKFPKINKDVIYYLKKENRKNDLEMFLKNKGNYEELFFFYLEKFFEINNFNERIECVKKLKEFHKKIDSNSNINLKFYNNFINDLENSIKLKKNLLDSDIIKSADIGTFDNSVYDCYKNIIKSGKFNIIEKENKKFDISQRKISILRLHSYIEMNEENAIEKLLAENTLKKLNLHPLNVAEIYLELNNKEKTVEYIKQINEGYLLDYKVDILKGIGKYEDALECIIMDKDKNNKEKRPQMVDDILHIKPELEVKIKEFLDKYKTSL